MEKRGQAVTEFITTYGWAFLILLLVILAIFALNLFNPDVPAECKFSPPFSCKDFVFREGGFELSLNAQRIYTGNVVASEIRVNDKSCKNVKVVGNPIGDLNLDNGINKIRCYGDVNEIKENDVVNAKVKIKYMTDDSDLEHSSEGTFSGKVEKSKYTNNFDYRAVVSYNFDEDNTSTVIDNSYYSEDGRLGLDIGGTIYPGPSLESDQSKCISNECYNFNLDNNFIAIINQLEDLTPGANNTIEFWMNWNGDINPMVLLNNANYVFYLKGCGAITNGFGFYGFGDLYGTYSTGMEDEWVYVVAIENNGYLTNSQIYINGQKVTQPPTLAECGSPYGALEPNTVCGYACMYIGAGELAINSYKGYIDEFRIYNQALTPEEIQKHYEYTKKSVSGGGGAPPGPDTTPPAVSVGHSPPNPTDIDQIILTATATDAQSGISQIQIFVDDTLAQTCTSSPCSTTPQTYATGFHTYYATAEDAATPTNQGRDPLTGTKNFIVTLQSGILTAAYNFNENLGTTVYDVSGNGINGNINGATWTAQGKYGNALSFDGLDDYTDLGNPPALQLTGSMTLSAWVKAIANPPDDGQIIAKSGASENGWQFKTSQDTGSRTFCIAVSRDGSEITQRCGTIVLNLNEWYYVAGVYDIDALALDIYVNGVLDNNVVLFGTIPSSQFNPNVNVNIGKREGGFYFNGIIDDIRVYDRALTQAEIQTDMNTPL